MVSTLIRFTPCGGSPYPVHRDHEHSPNQPRRGTSGIQVSALIATASPRDPPLAAREATSVLTIVKVQALRNLIVFCLRQLSLRHGLSRIAVLSLFFTSI